ncbi:MAG: 5-formyltetrahydrofolate cyclo-ligase [Oscillospiraceae bacterium]|nr:5-formyltetrahydrofolate cyclo-ligase [Oscillospiraceae bacterium]
MRMNKQVLRNFIRQKKKAMPPDEVRCRSEALCRKVIASDAYRNAKSIYGYIPFNQEVWLYPLLEQTLHDGKTLALPKCYGSEMRFIVVSDLTRIQQNEKGIPEPAEDAPVASDPHALVIVPGLAFDLHGYRVGYGGGYYDRFLALEPDHPTIGLCFDFQLVDQVPADPYDIPTDIVFSI